MKELYEQLKKKHSLPNFNKLDSIFEISTIDEDHFLLRGIRRKILEKISSMTGVLEELLQPEASFKCLMECKFFSDKEKEEVSSLFRKLMFLEREALELSVKEDDKKTAEYVKRVFDEWDKITETYLKIITKLKEAWKNNKTKKEIVGYLG